MLCVEVCTGCCVHTQRVFSAEGCCVHTQGTHRKEECCLWRCGVGVVCTHIGGKSVVCVEWVLCAHTRYKHRREKCCVWSVCCVHTQGREEC